MSVPQQTVHVELAERSYDIEIGSGNLADFGKLIESCGTISHAVLITDDNVDPLYGDRVADLLTAAKHCSRRKAANETMFEQEETKKTEMGT